MGRESHSRDINVFKLWSVIPCKRSNKFFKLWGSLAMQEEYLGLWSFPIFFGVLHETGKKPLTLNEAFMKRIWANQVLKPLLRALEGKHHS